METAIVFRAVGKVQRVGFRAFVRTTGLQMGLSGWVKNNPDGSVVGVAEGDHGMLVEFVKALKIGNRWSTVEDVEQQEQRFSGDYESFEIRY